MEIVIFYENKHLRKVKSNKIKHAEEMAGYILNNEDLLKKTVFLMGNLMFAESMVYANPVDTAVNGINVAGSTLLKLVQSFGYWGCILGCALEILKDLMAQNTRDIGKIIGKYAVAFGTFYFLPWVFDIVKTCFGGN